VAEVTRVLAIAEQRLGAARLDDALRPEDARPDEPVHFFCDERLRGASSA
jgi:hypothetical protein